MSEVEKLKIGSTDYDVRDANTLRSLNSTQAAQIVLDGTYNGVAVENGEVFTNEAGKFQEFVKTSVPAGTSSTVSSNNSGGTLASFKGVLIRFPITGTTGYYSTDNGSSWDSFTAPISGASYYGWNFGKTSDFIVATSTSGLMYSTNGTSWTAGTKPTSDSYGNITFSTANGKLYLNDRENVYYTSDGITWTHMDNLPITGAFRFISNDNIMVIIPDGLSSSSPTTWYKSTDGGSTWTDFTGANLWYQSNYKAVVLDTPSGWIISGNWSGNGSTRLYSSDFSSFSTVSAISGQTNGDALTTANGFCMIVPDRYSSASSNVYYYSADGSSWTQGTLPASLAYKCAAEIGNSVYIGNSRYTSTPLYRVSGEISYTYALTDLSKTASETPSVDQTFNGASANAQSGVAINGAGFLKNTATGTNAVGIGNEITSSSTRTIAIGYQASATNNDGIAVGYGATCSSAGNIAIGRATASGTRAIAIGYSSKAQANNAIQLGTGTNSTTNTLCVGFDQIGNYELLSADGTIPAGRLTNALQGAFSSANITLAVADWSANTQTVTVSGMKSTSFVWVSPSSNVSDYTSSGVICSAQGTDSLTFTCDTTPSNDLTVTVVFG